MNQLVIVCAGAHARDLANWSPIPVAGFLDDNISGPQIIGPTYWANRIDHNWIAGHNNGVVRQKFAAVIERPAVRLFSDRALIDHTVIADAGVFVGPNSTIGPQVVLGQHTHINANVFVTRAELGSFCTVSPGAVICGDVQIGDRVTVGAGAVVSNLVKIGSNVTIGAGCVIPPNQTLEANSTWVGVPARRVK